MDAAERALAHAEISNLLSLYYQALDRGELDHVHHREARGRLHPGDVAGATQSVRCDTDMLDLRVGLTCATC